MTLDLKLGEQAVERGAWALAIFADEEASETSEWDRDAAASVLTAALRLDEPETEDRIARWFHDHDLNSPRKHEDRKDGSSYRRLEWDELYEQAKVKYRVNARSVIAVLIGDTTSEGEDGQDG